MRRPLVAVTRQCSRLMPWSLSRTVQWLPRPRMVSPSSITMTCPVLRPVNTVSIARFSAPAGSIFIAVCVVEVPSRGFSLISQGREVGHLLLGRRCFGQQADGAPPGGRTSWGRLPSSARGLRVGRPSSTPGPEGLRRLVFVVVESLGRPLFVPLDSGREGGASGGFGGMREFDFAMNEYHRSGVGGSPEGPTNSFCPDNHRQDQTGTRTQPARQLEGFGVSSRSVVARLRWSIGRDCVYRQRTNR